MAILDLVPGLEAFVSVDRKDLDEYEDDDVVQVTPGPVGEYQARRTVSKFIESESEKEFCVGIRLHPGYKMDSPTLIVPVELDGKKFISPVLEKKAHPEIRNNVSQHKVEVVDEGIDVPAPGTAAGKAFLRKFRFSKINIDETKVKEIKKDTEQVKKLGQIVVEVYRGREVKELKEVPATRSKVDSQITSIHEKALKDQAKSHATSFGPAETLRTIRRVDCDWIDGEDYPVARFVFKYRSREALKQLLIIERTPSPDPEDAGPVDINSLDSAQKSRLDKFLQDLVNPSRASLITPDRAIKRERIDENLHPRKKLATGKKVTIDLTGDTEDEEED